VNPFARIGIVIAVASAVAYGKSPEVKQAEQIQKNAQEMAQGAEITGWDRGRPEAERMTMPVSFAYASTRYTKGDFEITEKITDSGFNQLLAAPLTMMLTAGYAKETNDGFEKSTTVTGYPAFEKWDRSDKSGDLTARHAECRCSVQESVGRVMPRSRSSFGGLDVAPDEDAL